MWTGKEIFLNLKVEVSADLPAFNELWHTPTLKRE